MGQVVFRGVTKRFGDTVAVDRLTLTVSDGELLVLLGPSGCGKTTALRMVAGLETADEGTLSIGDRVVNDVEPKDRDVAMVFQSYALYPHLTVAKNIEFPLRQRGIDRAERSRRVGEAARRLGLEELLGRKPGQLSGGQRQRVALARAIVRDPQVFLMDEPLSNLDAALRVQTRADIVALQERLGTTMLYVTHDQVEAMTMGDRIAVMRQGVLQQVAPPQEAYDRPGNTFVAAFLGSPGMNLFDGRYSPDAGPGGAPAVVVAGGTVPVDAGGGGPTACPDAITVGVRPESMTVGPDGTIDASVVIVEVLGAEVLVVCRSPDATRVVVRQGAERPRPSIGEAVRIGVDPGAVHLFDRASGRRLDGRPQSEARPAP
jgi:multiple sugar transport system ATP-binding protein